MKRLRVGPFKTQLTEQYEVSFRNGGSDVLTLDGLSENHATDISQNRQNGKCKYNLLVTTILFNLKSGPLLVHQECLLKV